MWCGKGNSGAEAMTARGIMTPCGKTWGVGMEETRCCSGSSGRIIPQSCEGPALLGLRGLGSSRLRGVRMVGGLLRCGGSLGMRDEGFRGLETVKRLEVLALGNGEREVEVPW